MATSGNGSIDKDQVSMSQEMLSSARDLNVIPANQISLVWNASDPSAQVKQLFLQFLSSESEAKKHDFQKWDEYEMRFEDSELNWICDFILNNLVFCKS